MDMARQMREVEKQAMKQFGEQLERNRDGDMLALVGRRNPQKQTFQFLHDADVAVGDVIRSVASGHTFILTDIDKHVTGSQVVGIVARYETPEEQAKRLTTKQPQPPVTHVTIGSVQGSILNLTSQLEHVTQSINALPNTSDADKQALADLMQQLTKELQDIPVEHAEDAETVTERAESMAKEAKKAKPDPEYLKVSADGLMKAAKNIALVAPAVLDIATQIADRLQAAGLR